MQSVKWYNMVLEQIFSAKWMEKKPAITFFLGFVYAELGLISALLIFPQDPSLIAIGFISILILPSLNHLLALEENEDTRTTKFGLGLFRAHFDIIEIYLFLFLGILLAYSLFAMLLPPQAATHVFETQLDVYQNVRAGGAYLAGSAAALSGSAGGCVTQACQFTSILFNNLKVLLVCILFSLVYGAGAILFLTWNASVWGAIFGFVANKSHILATVSSYSHTIFAVLPHMITEALAYLVAAFAGGIISKAVIREQHDSERFARVFTDALIFFGISFLLVIVGAWMEVYLFPLLYR